MRDVRLTWLPTTPYFKRFLAQAEASSADVSLICRSKIKQWGVSGKLSPKRRVRTLHRVVSISLSRSETAKSMNRSILFAPILFLAGLSPALCASPRHNVVLFVPDGLRAGIVSSRDCTDFF